MTSLKFGFQTVFHFLQICIKNSMSWLLFWTTHFDHIQLNLSILQTLLLLQEVLCKIALLYNLFKY